MADLTANSTLLKYVEQGSGPSVMLVHGSVSDYRTWQKQMEVFSRQFHVIAYSRRYHWPNEPIEEGEDYSMLQHVDDLGAVIRSLEVDPVHLVGHSYGAFLCLLLAIREPSLVRTLVLAEPPVITLFVSNSPKPPELLKLLVTRPRTAVSIFRFVALGMAPAAAAARKDNALKSIKSFGRACLGREAYRNLSESRLEQVRANFIKAELLGSGLTPLDSNDVRNIHTPVLLLNAQDSPPFFHRLADRLEILLPDVRRTTVFGASHIMHEDNPAAFNSTVVSFLQKHSG
jgi:pimeloyl-ACP methyl ester carboxylesterase